MIDLSSLIGNETVKAVLKQETLCQSFLIEGEVGSGRHTLADILTRAAMCTDTKVRPCGRCDACKKAQSGSHVDVIRIPSDCKTEELRAYLETVAVYPNDGGKKVYLIDEAEKLGVIQQNVLLKTLEEPPSYAVFILLCVSREGLLETIRSRCLILTMQPLSDGEIKKALHARFPQTEEELLLTAVSRANGCLGVAVQALEDSRSDFYEKVEAVAAAALSADYPLLISLLSAEKDRNAFRRLIGGVREWFNRRLIGRALEKNDAVGKTERQAGLLPPQTLAAYAGVFAELEEKALLNVNLSLWSVATARKCYEIYNPAEMAAKIQEKKR